MDLYIHNLLTGSITISDLGIIVPASSNLQVLPNKGFELEDIHTSTDLQTNILADNILFSYDGITILTKQDSLDILTDVSVETVEDEIREEVPPLIEDEVNNAVEAAVVAGRTLPNLVISKQPGFIFNRSGGFVVKQEGV